ncbi:15744_t:CDS:2, partial [Dentiscutata erythropus]
ESEVEFENETMSRSLGDDQIQNDKIILNVDTLLGTMFHPRNKEMLHPTNGNEYFIDRSGYAFYYILEYYRTGSIIWSPALETLSDFSSPPLSTIIPCSPSISSSHTEVNNATVPTGAAAAVIASTSSFINKKFNYFQIPFTSQVSVAQKAAGELLDSFAYAIEEVLCASIAKLIDRISITFYRDGSQMEYLQFSQEVHKLREFSLNGYCIINHFYEDIKKYLEEIFPNMKIKLEFGANYKCLTISMSHLFTRNTIKEHSKIGKLNKN